MMIEDAVDFLKKVPPFRFLDEAKLREVSAGVSIELYPKGSIILQQNGPPSRYLRIIKKGGVKVFMKTSDDEEVIIDYRGEGESFGLLSLVGGDKSRANVVATEDTICYLINNETVMRLIDSNAAFTEFFLRTFFNKYIDKTYKEMQDRSLLYSGGDKILFSTPLGELVSTEVTTASQEITIKEAAELMSRHSISSVVLVDPADDVPVGIVTDRDLRDKVLAKGRSVFDPVSSIMSISLIKAEAHDYCFEALLKMIRYNIHHLLVVDQGRLRGIITNHDLMMLQGISPLSIAREIEGQKSVEGLVPASKKINKIVELLIKEGAKASNITRIITEINDRLLKKIIEITELRLGPPPLSYCWIAFGSEGRKEQTFKTDQDNAIIYDDPRNEEEAEKAGRYFTNFALYMKDALVKCGFPPCPADYMASNPKWRQPLRIWKEYFSGWINEPTPEAILWSLIFFDFRPISGNVTLARKLRAYLNHALRDQKLFFVTMASVVVKSAPPLGFFGTLVVEKRGEHKNELNIKEQGIALIVDAIRLFALEQGVDGASTIERIRDLRDRHEVVRDYGDGLEQAFEFLMLLRLNHQFDLVHNNRIPDNFINPDVLSSLERNTLKESFKLLSRIHSSIIEKYKPLIVTKL